MQDVRKITLNCKDCGAEIEIQSSTISGAYALAKKNGWAVSRIKQNSDGSSSRNYFCKDCAKAHRHVGCHGVRRNIQTRLDLGEMVN